MRCHTIIEAAEVGVITPVLGILIEGEIEIRNGDEIGEEMTEIVAEIVTEEVRPEIPDTQTIIGTGVKT